MLESKLGLARDDADFTNNLKLISASKPERVSERCEILTAKRRLNNQATRTVFHLQTADEKKLDIVFQISDGGGNLSFHREKITVKAGQKVELTLKPHGGFVIISE